jgi:hypothetical protein
METKLVVFQNKEIRRTLHNGEWWFSITDVIGVLVESSIPRRYWSDLKRKLTNEGYNELYEKIVQLKLPSTDGKSYSTDCGNTETMLRIIQSIPSPKAEPFKRWLAKVGYERVQEIEDTELATARTRELYRAKGYSETWIEKRMRGIAVRAELTEEWKQRGVKESPEYAILTAEISKAAFGMTPREYKELKGLERENLRDHMTDLELIFSMLGEAATTEIARKQDPQGFPENRAVARKGGKIAGDAREKLEIETGESVVRQDNYLSEPESKKRLLNPPQPPFHKVGSKK